ncbi:MAG: S-layer homology domain-containing protein, partial [Clostridiales bacterium]|nr:S-layer homology domain-containing protein [Clostridiales bacterium]
ETVVYNKGTVGGSSILKEGDRISYITRSSDNVVKFVNVLSNVNDVRYVAAQINSNDSTNLLINVTQLFKMDYPDLALARQSVSFSMDGEPSLVSYRYAKNVTVTIDGRTMKIADISPDMTVILTIGPDNIVTAITATNLNINSDSGNIVKGIVEENNPQLGYITLYDESGAGSAASSPDEVSSLRTYNYVNENSLEIYRNNKAADIDSILAGDTAFLKLDDEGSIVSVSAADNYSVKYGVVVSKLAGSIGVEYADGSQQVFEVGDDVLFIQDKKPSKYSSLKEGDRVKLIINENQAAAGLKEVTIEGDEHYITNIYKGKLQGIDELSDKVKLWNVSVYNNGKWERTDTKGLTTLSLSEGCSVYNENSKLTPEKANTLLIDEEAYVAVEKDYGGNEKAVKLTFRNVSDKELLYTDTVSGISTGSGKFSLQNAEKSVLFGAGSIIVKYGRLISGNGLSAEDAALVVANRDYDTNDIKAAVVKVDEKKSNSFATVYRARITEINDNEDFTVESYSMLSDTNWSYYNTEKTFTLSPDTKLLGDSGLTSLRNFLGYGTGSYLGRSVYILADGTGALIISTAAYGASFAKGTVYEVSGATYGTEEGLLLTEPTTLKLRNTAVYSTTTYSWTSASEITLTMLSNSIIIKNGAIAKPSDIKKGDVVSVVKKDTAVTGDAYIITVE